MDLMTAIATAGQAIKLVQDLRGIGKAFDAAEFKLKIADLNEALADLKMALIDAKDELASKDYEIAKLKEQFRHRAELVEYKGFRYDKTKDGKPKGNPYCPVCEQKLGLLFHLTRILGKDSCPHCKAMYSAHLFGHDD